jgi:hypothetical protein
MEAYVAGVSTRSVDDLVAASSIDSGISKSEVSRICAGLDEVVTAFRLHCGRGPVRAGQGACRRCLGRATCQCKTCTWWRSSTISNASASGVGPPRSSRTKCRNNINAISVAATSQILPAPASQQFTPHVVS